MNTRVGQAIVGACAVLLGSAVLLSAPTSTDQPEAAPEFVAEPSASSPSPTPSRMTAAPVRPHPDAPRSASPKASRSPSSAAPSARPSARPTTKPSAPKVTKLYPVTAFFSQATIDRGKLVTWTTRPTCILAGHDTMGWSWIDDIPTGRTVKVMTGPCAGTYKVVGHKWQSVKGGPIPLWMSSYDLVLQTCTGSSGMGFSVLQRA